MGFIIHMHILGTSHFVHYREIVLFSKNVYIIAMGDDQYELSFIERLSFSEGPLSDVPLYIVCWLASHYIEL